ncbi:hypothetical protein M011DRAFT_88576 [Sporormia fimetaria CBS 119925]|uniref:Uncharacterized protein n=1 Tax=Sporormia fimetaria CBS 119925 TaxID=1340428 RepID=A0A6A6VA84_9PLEO|nr:hypothetical protein M011DRAFT_88576 [Sporormia fimetaria CBS 119925]
MSGVFGRYRGGGGVEEIDLTLSSPEPEPTRSRDASSNRVKDESPRSQVSSNKVKAESDRPQIPRFPNEPTVGSVILPEDLPINPAHLTRIIDTTPREPLKAVLIQLCEISPAFSGALARGLAPHSLWAQDLIKHHNTSNPMPEAHTRSPGPERLKNPPTHSSQTPKRSPSHMAGSPSLSPWRRTPGTGTVCTHCQKPCTVGSKEPCCYYHPGQKRKRRDISGQLSVTFTCCEQDLDAEGCIPGPRTATLPGTSSFESLKMADNQSGNRKSPKLR